VIKSAKLRQMGVGFIDHLLKQGQAVDPMEMRRDAQYNTGLRELWSNSGISPDDIVAQQAAVANNDDIYRRIQKLYEKTTAPAQGLNRNQPSTLSEMAAASKKPTNITAENAPKIVSAPK